MLLNKNGGKKISNW